MNSSHLRLAWLIPVAMMISGCANGSVHYSTTPMRGNYLYLLMPNSIPIDRIALKEQSGRNIVFVELKCLGDGCWAFWHYEGNSNEFTFRVMYGRADRKYEMVIDTTEEDISNGTILISESDFEECLQQLRMDTDAVIIKYELPEAVASKARRVVIIPTPQWILGSGPTKYDMVRVGSTAWYVDLACYSPRKSTDLLARFETYDSDEVLIHESSVMNVDVRSRQPFSQNGSRK